MSKVYVVSNGDRYDYSIIGIFSTKEKAEEFVGVDKGFSACAIDEYILDADLDYKVTQVYQCILNKSLGSIIKESTSEWGNLVRKTYTGDCFASRDYIKASSAISAEDARERALTMWLDEQEELREKVIAQKI